MGEFNADCLGVNEKKIIEVEIKTSREDLKNDFRKYKHSLYNKTYEEIYRQWIPTHFYYCIPEEMIEYCKNCLTVNKYDNYGIISQTGYNVIKRAKPLHSKEPNTHIKFKLALRMGSELIRFHEAWL